MGKKFHPKDQFLRDLVQCFEDSIKNSLDTFFPEEELEQIIEYYESIPNYERALLATNRAIELFPYSGAFYVKEAQLHFYTKTFEAAWDAIDRAKIYDSHSSELMLIEADLLTAEGNYEEAIICLKELYDSIGKSEKPDVLLEMADVYEIAEDMNALNLVLRRVLRDYPENEEALHRFWNLTIDQELYTESLEIFQNITEQQPYNYIAWYYTAKCQEEIGLIEKAIESFEYTMAINDYYFAYWDYGICLQQLKRWQDALNHYIEMESIFESEYSIYLEQGLCYRELKQFQLAIAVFFKAKDKTSEKQKKAEAEYQIGKVYQTMNHTRQALAHFQIATQLRGDKTKYWNATGRQHYLMNNYAETISCMIQSLAKNDAQPKQWLMLSDCYLQLGAKELAIDSLRKASSIMPEHVKINYFLAALLIHFGQAQSGLVTLEHALSLDSSKKEIIFTLFPELKNNSDVLYLIEQF